MTNTIGSSTNGNSGVDVGVTDGVVVTAGMAVGLEVLEPEVVVAVGLALGDGLGLTMAVGEFKAMTMVWLLWW